MAGYKIGSKSINIVYILRWRPVFITDSDDKEVSKCKTKSLIICRKPLRCKLEIEGYVVEQFMTFKYRGVSSARDNNCLEQLKWES